MNMQENSKIPVISVIMGIYNCANTLPYAVDCIVAQTYSDWELIMCDDGSTDDTYSVAMKYAKIHPEKIVVLKNNTNRGLNYTLNKCLKYSHGEYIARMDGDDLCQSNRFEKELEVFKKEPNISIVSSDMCFFDENGTWGIIQHPTYPEKKDFVHGSPFCHAPCMVKREAFETVKGYTEAQRLLRVEDYHLWVKMYAAGFKGKNIHIPLYQMRDDRNAYARRKFKYRINESYVKYLLIQKLQLPKWMIVYAIRPILTGLLPQSIYNFFRKKNLKSIRTNI